MAEFDGESFARNIATRITELLAEQRQDYKTDNGMKFKRSAYLINDSDLPSEWKVRVEESPGQITVAQLGRAAAALSPKGYRGQKTEASPAQIAKARKKLISLYHKEGVKNEDIPEYLFSEEDVMIENFNEESFVQKVVDAIRGLISKKPEGEDDSQKFTEQLEAEKAKFAEQLATRDAEAKKLAEEKATLEAAKAEADKKVQEFSEKAAAEERKRRLAEFTEKATELGVPLKAEEFAETLLYFNDADTSEGKARYEQLIAVLKAKGNAAEMAKLFSESGTDAVGATPVGKLDALVAKRMVESKEDISTATLKVIEEHPELYKEYSESLPKATVRQVEQQ